MDNEGLAFGSLCLWAKEDNPVKFKEIKSRSLHSSLLDSLSLTHSDIAEVVYKFYKGEFVCAYEEKAGMNLRIIVGELLMMAYH